MKENNILRMMLAITVSMVAGTITLVIPNLASVSAEANCDNLVGPNDAGNNKGNFKQCSIFTGNEDPKEPHRSSDSPNVFKDNDGDGDVVGKIRGNN